ncbi:MAG: 4-hydroxythreonine-4-phosphate dehydrogenase PdxA [bacterium]|nr:4-hydroxythreonine-4-phosphate dehydrogenase PdxA [bacterium]
MDKIRLGISTGDYNGIGPEIIIKALNDPLISGLADFHIFGSKTVFDLTSKSLKKEMDFTASMDMIKRTIIIPEEEIDPKDFTPSRSTDVSGSFAYKCLSSAIDHWRDKKIDGIVTAPVQKSTFFPEAVRFNGQTEWIADRIGCKNSLMFMIKDNIRIAPVTTHIAVKDIPGRLTQELIFKKGSLIYCSLKQDFGISEPVIAVCGLNPHCGEEGRFGAEEESTVRPAVEALIKSGGNWTGPLPADTVFTKRSLNNYDAVLAMYHDQGLIPFKIFSGLAGVNFTAGMPLVRTSPDHGTALDIAGKGIADESGMKEAIRTAVGIIKRRIH